MMGSCLSGMLDDDNKAKDLRALSINSTLARAHNPDLSLRCDGVAR